MKINGINLEHLPLTLKNEIVCRVAYTKAREFIQSKSIESVLRNIARLRQEHDALREFIDELGMINSTSILIYSQRLKDNHLQEWMYQKREAEKEEKGIPEYEPLTDEVARALAEQELQSNLKTFLKDNPQVGRTLYFDTEVFPISLDGLKIGIDIIRETVDRSRLTQEEIDMIDSDMSGEYWQNVTAPEVADYVTKFCSSFK